MKHLSDRAVRTFGYDCIDPLNSSIFWNYIVTKHLFLRFIRSLIEKYGKTYYPFVRMNLTYYIGIIGNNTLYLCIIILKRKKIYAKAVKGGKFILLT